jgi:hypothetical protein
MSYGHSLKYQKLHFIRPEIKNVIELTILFFQQIYL